MKKHRMKIILGIELAFIFSMLTVGFNGYSPVTQRVADNAYRYDLNAMRTALQQGANLPAAIEAITKAQGFVMGSAVRVTDKLFTVTAEPAEGEPVVLVIAINPPDKMRALEGVMVEQVNIKGQDTPVAFIPTAALGITGEITPEKLEKLMSALKTSPAVTTERALKLIKAEDVDAVIEKLSAVFSVQFAPNRLVVSETDKRVYLLAPNPATPGQPSVYAVIINPTKEQGAAALQVASISAQTGEKIPVAFMLATIETTPQLIRIAEALVFPSVVPPKTAPGVTPTMPADLTLLSKSTAGLSIAEIIRQTSISPEEAGAKTNQVIRALKQVAILTEVDIEQRQFNVFMERASNAPADSAFNRAGYELRKIIINPLVEKAEANLTPFDIRSSFAAAQEPSFNDRNVAPLLRLAAVLGELSERVGLTAEKPSPISATPDRLEVYDALNKIMSTIEGFPYEPSEGITYGEIMSNPSSIESLVLADMLHYMRECLQSGNVTIADYDKGLEGTPAAKEGIIRPFSGKLGFTSGKIRVLGGSSKVTGETLQKQQLEVFEAVAHELIVSYFLNNYDVQLRHKQATPLTEAIVNMQKATYGNKFEITPAQLASVEKLLAFRQGMIMSSFVEGSGRKPADLLMPSGKTSHAMTLVEQAAEAFRGVPAGPAAERAKAVVTSLETAESALEAVVTGPVAEASTKLSEAMEGLKQAMTDLKTISPQEVPQVTGLVQVTKASIEAMEMATTGLQVKEAAEKLAQPLGTIVWDDTGLPATQLSLLKKDSAISAQLQEALNTKVVLLSDLGSEHVTENMIVITNRTSADIQARNAEKFSLIEKAKYLQVEYQDGSFLPIAPITTFAKGLLISDRTPDIITALQAIYRKITGSVLQDLNSLSASVFIIKLLPVPIAIDPTKYDELHRRELLALIAA